jgi:hypothetical protein
VATGIILSHSHPSGNLTPSQADIGLTRKLKEAGKLLEIQVLDHLILTTKSIIHSLMKVSYFVGASRAADHPSTHHFYFLIDFNHMSATHQTWQQETIEASPRRGPFQP